MKNYIIFNTQIEVTWDYFEQEKKIFLEIVFTYLCVVLFSKDSLNAHIPFSIMYHTYRVHKHLLFALNVFFNKSVFKPTFFKYFPQFSHAKYIHLFLIVVHTLLIDIFHT